MLLSFPCLCPQIFPSWDMVGCFFNLSFLLMRKSENTIKDEDDCIVKSMKEETEELIINLFRGRHKYTPMEREREVHVERECRLLGHWCRGSGAISFSFSFFFFEVFLEHKSKINYEAIFCNMYVHSERQTDRETEEERTEMCMYVCMYMYIYIHTYVERRAS